MTSLVGTGGLVRLILRRDRFLLPLWIVTLALLPLTYASATEELYPTAAGRQEYYASIAANPSLTATVGPVFGASVGALTAWRSGILIVLIGLVSLLTVIRHTRTEEDAGRRELLGSTVAGRHAALAAALVVTFAADLLLGVLFSAGLAGYGLPGAGAVAYGFSYAVAGWLFAAVGAVAAQLTEGAGAARGMALSVLGGAFLLRAVGDSGGEAGGTGWLSWVSPIGWVQRVRPFAGERWWVFALLGGLLVVSVWVAVVLQSHRDMGAGVLPPRLGPAEAPRRFRGPFALAWRLHRGLLLGWSAGFAVIGLVLGGATQSIDQLVRGSAQLGAVLARMGGAAALKDTYIAASVGMLALAAGAYAVQATLRLRAEETALRAEPVLVTSVGRVRWMASHLVFAFVGPAVALAALGAGTGLVSGAAEGDVAGQLPRTLAAAMVQLPAVWVLGGVAVALFGVLPRAVTGVAWGALAVCVFLTLVGALLRLEQWMLDVSPFSHIPKVPAEEVSAMPLVWLFALVAGLVAVGLSGFRRRDLG